MKRAAVLFLLASCAAPPPPPPPPGPPPIPPATKAEVVEILSALEQSFYAHWGAVEKTAEYAKLRDGHLPFLREIADSNGLQALMAFRVLARRAPEEKFSDDAKVILYSSAFEREQNFTRWGVISGSGFLPGVYGQELLSLGKAAAPYLQKSLRTRRRAPVVGGEAERRNLINGDRVCDYAWVFLATIFDRPLAYHEDSRLRDDQIKALDVWLDRNR